MKINKFAIIVILIVIVIGWLIFQRTNTANTTQSATTETTVTNETKSIVLVHGAFQDSSAWDEVKPRLDKKGYKVTTIDLPGRPKNSTPAGETSLELYRDTVIKELEKQEGKVILVGHSFGGITISEVAEKAPEKIETLVYLAAYLPQTGQSLQSLSGEDKNNKFTQDNFLVNQETLTASVLKSDRNLIFCDDCSEEWKEKLPGMMVDEPLPPMGGTASVTEENFGKVNKVYIKTTIDNAISPQLQQIMIDRNKINKVYELESGHSPFYSTPEELANLLIKIAQENN